MRTRWCGCGAEARACWRSVDPHATVPHIYPPSQDGPDAAPARATPLPALQPEAELEVVVAALEPLVEGLPATFNGLV